MVTSAAHTLGVRKQHFNLMMVGFANIAAWTQLTFAFVRTIAQKVAFIYALVFKLARRGSLEALFSAGVGFDLWHSSLDR